MPERVPGASGQPWPAVDGAVALEPGEELVAGRRPVEEAFAARRVAHRLYVVPQRRAPLEALVLHATTLRIPVVEIEGGSLTALAGFDGHQGVALAVAPREWATLDDVMARAAERGERPFVLVLDSLEDPHNLGSMLRTAEAAGVHGVCFQTHHAVPLTPSAVKSSAGAVEHLLLVPVEDLGGLLVDLRGRGLRLVGADAGATLTYRDADLRGPLAMVVGSEGRGLSGPVRRRLDLTVRIPMHGRVASLNAAVAGSVVLLEVATQRGLPDVPHEPGATDLEPEPEAAGPEPETAESEVVAVGEVKPTKRAPLARAAAGDTSAVRKTRVRRLAAPVAPETPTPATTKPRARRPRPAVDEAPPAPAAPKPPARGTQPARVTQPARGTKPALDASPPVAAKTPAPKVGEPRVKRLQPAANEAPPAPAAPKPRRRAPTR